MLKSNYREGFVSPEELNNLRRISIPSGYYFEMQTSAPIVGIYYGVFQERSSDSPPLSSLEIDDLNLSSEEYRRGEAPSYENADEFIRALMSEREEANRN